MRFPALSAFAVVTTFALSYAALLARDPAAEAAARSTFIVVYDAGPRWQAGVPPSEQPGVRDHGRYLVQLYAEGTMQSAGPLEGGGGVVIFRAEDEAAARAIIDADPGVASGLLVVNMLRRWEPRDWESIVRR